MQIGIIEIANTFASTLPKPHSPALLPKLCQRACKIKDLNLKIFLPRAYTRKLLQQDKQLENYQIKKSRITRQFSGTETNK